MKQIGLRSKIFSLRKFALKFKVKLTIVEIWIGLPKYLASTYPKLCKVSTGLGRILFLMDIIPFHNAYFISNGLNRPVAEMLLISDT